MERKTDGVINLYPNKQDLRRLSKLSEEYEHHMKKATLLKNKMARMNLRFHQNINR